MNVYDLTVPQITRVLLQAKGWLDKAEAFAVEKGLETQSLLEARLAPDQFHFTKQIQVLSDNAKGLTARLSGQEAPSFEDNEKTLDELRARLDKTLAFLSSVSRERFEAAEERKIRLFFLPPGKHLTACEYLVEFAIPNFYFHATTAYAILRSKGVPLGKMDFLGQLTLRDDEPAA